MGYEEIVRGWLTISFSHKRQIRSEGKLTPKKHRTPLGDKGLGRLSTQRLGHRLEMFTCKEKIEAESGPDSIAFLTSAKCTNEENYLLQKFARAVIGTNNVDHCARL